MRSFYGALLAVALAVVPAGLCAAEIKVAESPVPAASYAEVTFVGGEKGDNVAWDVYPEPTKLNDLGDGRLFFSGPPGTKYRVTADVVNFDTKTRKKYRTEIVIAGPPVDPPAPPVPPGPADQFTQDVAVAYATEPASDRQKNTRALASLYRVAAASTVLDPAVKTYADLFADLKSASPALLPATALPAVRKVVGDRLGKSFGTGAAAINRALAATELQAVADALAAAAK